MSKEEQMGQEKNSESQQEQEKMDVKVEINGVIEHFTSKAEWRDFLESQLNEQQ